MRQCDDEIDFSLIVALLHPFFVFALSRFFDFSNDFERGRFAFDHFLGDD